MVFVQARFEFVTSGATYAGDYVACRWLVHSGTTDARMRLAASERGSELVVGSK